MKNDTEKQAESIRSDIDATRQRMDETMDALSNRLQGRHLIDEILGLFRRDGGDGKLSHMKDNISHSASNAMHGVFDTVKANPMPALLIGAGVAWLAFASRRSHSPAQDWSQDMGDETGHLRYDPDVHYDRPLEYPAGELELGAEGSSTLSGMGGMMGDKAAGAKEKLGEIGHQAKEKLSAAGHYAGEKMHSAREHADNLGHKARERVAATADQHPLELGLGCLAAGLLIGLAVPTPAPVNRIAGSAVDRLRDRAREAGREAMEKGKRVAQAATEAVKEETEAQGLTPEHLREKAQVVAEHTKEATKEAARNEGFGSEENQNPSHPQNQNTPASDPTGARRDM